MSYISPIGSGQNCYKVNPLLEDYFRTFQSAKKELDYLEGKVNRGYASPNDLEKLAKVQRTVDQAQNDCKNIPPIIKGGDLNQNNALAEAGQIQRKIDYYC